VIFEFQEQSSYFWHEDESCKQVLDTSFLSMDSLLVLKLSLLM